MKTDIHLRFAYFVDGSNLSGVLREMQLNVDDYETFFTYLHGKTTKYLEDIRRVKLAAVMQRVYWYAVGTMDDWDLASPKAQDAIRRWFENTDEVVKPALERAGKSIGQSAKQMTNRERKEAIQLEAWSDHLANVKAWYERKSESLLKSLTFHHAVQANTDGIDIIAAGHWKLNMVTLGVEEKGLDTRLAVDMVALENNYDIAVVLSGDADMIPSIDLMKKRGKMVAAFEFFKGLPPEDKGRGFSSKLKLSADFVVPIYEGGLLTEKIAKHRTPDSAPSRGTESRLSSEVDESFGDGVK